MPTSQVEFVTIAHKIELVPSNKAKTHFRQAFGCARLAYNWGLSEWKRRYELGESVNYQQLKKDFNAIKKEKFPFVYNVSKYATQQPFIYLNLAFQKFFRDLKQGKISYPKFKRRKDNSGSYYIGGDQVVLKDDKHLKIPNLGIVKMREKLRFRAESRKINSVTISQNANKFYASFSMQITKEEYERTHKANNAPSNAAVGIDLGIKEFIFLSDGLQIKAPKPLSKLSRRLTKYQRQLNKKQHAKTKQEALQGVKKSRNYVKFSAKLAKLHARVANVRKDFLHKLTSVLVRTFDYFGLEDLNTGGMLKNHRLAKSLSDVSFFEFNRQLEYKSLRQNKLIYRVGRFYPSSKTCSACGSVKQDLTLKDRVYVCNTCGSVIDRDYNASLNLLNFVKQSVGQVLPELTPVDLTALQSDLAINLIATSKIEAGI